MLFEIFGVSYLLAPTVHFVSSEGQIVRDIIISGTSLIQKDAACKHQGPCAYTEAKAETTPSKKMRFFFTFEFRIYLELPSVPVGIITCLC